MPWWSCLSCVSIKIQDMCLSMSSYEKMSFMQDAVILQDMSSEANYETLDNLVSSG